MREGGHLQEQKACVNFGREIVITVCDLQYSCLITRCLIDSALNTIGKPHKFRTNIAKQNKDRSCGHTIAYNSIQSIMNTAIKKRYLVRSASYLQTFCQLQGLFSM